MSATTKVKVLGSHTALAVPLPTALAERELAVNTVDKKLYTKNSLGQVVELYSQKADSHSPTFTGVPTTPTASSIVNSDQIASTAFVQGHITNLTNLIATLEARVTLLEGA